MAEPEARIWATATDLKGTEHQRKRYFIAIEDGDTRKDVELVIGPGPAISVELFVPHEFDYTVHDACDHESGYCVLDDPETQEFELANLAQMYYSDKKQQQEQAWQVQAIARYSELHMSIRAGAYDEREPDGSYGADGIEREYSELEYQANQRGLNFVWHQDSQIYTLDPMSPEELAAFKAAQEEYY